MSHRYDPSCYCQDCCDAEERLQMKIDRERSAKIEARKREQEEEYLYYRTVQLQQQTR